MIDLSKIYVSVDNTTTTAIYIDNSLPYCNEGYCKYIICDYAPESTRSWLKSINDDKGVIASTEQSEKSESLQWVKDNCYDGDDFHNFLDALKQSEKYAHLFNEEKAAELSDGHTPVQDQLRELLGYAVEKGYDDVADKTKSILQAF